MANVSFADREISCRQYADFFLSAYGCGIANHRTRTTAAAKKKARMQAQTPPACSKTLYSRRVFPYSTYMTSDMQPLYIIDAYGLIYRSYFAFVSRPLVNARGENVSAVFGFFRNLKSLMDTHHPAYIAAAFDSRTKTFRHDAYPEYKATRQKTPEDLHAQVPLVEEILTALGIPVLRKDGVEADDVIAALAARCEQQGRQCLILSGDKDLMQLVTGTVSMMRPDKNGGWQHIGPQDVLAEWGVPPEKMLDLLSLTGDSADNVPGVAGVGDKTAVRLLTQYGSLDGIYAHAEEISGALGNKVRAGKDSAYFSRSLIMLKTDVDIPADIPAFAAQADNAKAAALLYGHGLPSVARLFEHGSSAEPDTAPNGQHAQPELAAAVQEAQTAVPQLAKNTGTYTALTDIAELRAYIDGFFSAGHGEIAFDSETDSLDTRHAHIVGCSLSYTAGSGVYAPLVQPELSGSAECLPQADVFAELSRLFLNPNITVVMHNGKFDYEVLMSNGFPRPVCRIADTMIAAWLLEPDRASFGLQQLSESRLGLETTAYGDIVPKRKTFADVPLEQAAAYAAEDADLTWQLWQLFSPELERNGLAELFTELEMPVLPVLAYMELAGIHIEKKELDAYGQELKKKLAELETEIHRLAGRPFNIASPKQLQEILFTELKLPAQKKTKTGYSTDTAVLENLKALHPVPAKILEYRMYAKLLSTYVETLPALADENGRIHTTFMQTGTATGRLSSRDPNLQNIPIREEAGRRIRQAFTASDGMALISADYSQIELVILAHLSQDRALCDAFRNGADVHRSTAALIFGVAEDQVLPEMRRTAKVINFGVMYGMSAFRLSNELGIPRAQASAFISQYFATYAGIRTFIEETVRRAEETGYVQTLYGRKRMIRNIHSKNKMEKAGAERIAVNTPIQGSAADIVKKAMLAVSALLARAYPQARLLLQVHDELIVECPEEQAAQAAQDIKDCMERAASLSVPLKVSVEYGARWGDFH